MGDAFFRALEKMDSRTAIVEHNVKAKQKRVTEMIEEQKRYYSDANETVLEFIAEFSNRGSPDVRVEDSYEAIRSTFRAGYCYYFAHMLKLAFGRGCVCWAAPFSHIVWVDTDGMPYDIEGVYAGYLLIADTIKEDAAEGIALMKEKGVEHIIMLTGDSKAVAEAVGSKLGIDEIYSELLPQDKVEKMA